MLEFTKPGMLTLIEGGGRIGYQRFGVPVAGAMDQSALNLANVLVGNALDADAIEVTFLGPTIQFHTANCFAITGSDLGATLDGEPIENNRAYAAPAGALLRTGAATGGCRAYIAVAGGLDADLVMGSRSTYMKGKIGGISGRKAAKGDTLRFLAPVAELPHLAERVAPPELLPPYSSSPCLRVVLGPQDECFQGAGQQTLFNSVYEVTPENDRMGYRLSGPSIALAPGEDNNILSDGVCFGSIQIPKDQPIIMMADRQTTGGYAKLGCVISVDLPLLAQLKLGDQVSFAPVSIEEAQSLYCRRMQALHNLAAQWQA